MLPEVVFRGRQLIRGEKSAARLPAHYTSIEVAARRFVPAGEIAAVQIINANPTIGRRRMHKTVVADINTDM